MPTYVLIGDAPYAQQVATVQIARSITRDLPQGGDGFLAGTYPDGITRVEGVPASCTVRVLYRVAGYGDGVLVAEVQSAVDGTWEVGGLNPSLKYDVVCRHDGYNDSIYSGVTPVIA